MRDVIIIGGGHNGLVAAAFLAKAGLRPLVLERADRVGGCAITSEIAPGYRCPTLAHRAGIDPRIMRALALRRHGLEVLTPAARVCAPVPDGRALTVWTDPSSAAREIAAFSTRDAERYGRFLSSVAAVCGVLRGMSERPPPSTHRLSVGGFIDLLKTARRFRALATADAHRLLRWLPMSAADFVREWFESEPLGAVVAADGTLGALLGPRSGGSAGALLWLAAGDGHPIAPGWSARGGIGAVSEALAGAARRAGAEIRVGAEVRHIVVRDGGADGVVLETGERITARLVVSNADPIRTLLGLVGAEHLPAAFVQALRSVRMRGTLAKINYAVSALPSFAGVAAPERHAALSGCIRLCPDIDTLERAFDAAKYGQYGSDPWIELAIPSILDPSLTPAGQHVVSAYVQFAPLVLKESTWEHERERFADLVTGVIARYAPGFDRSVLVRQIISPSDLERTYALTGAQIFHGEIALDQLWAARPVLGWARYDTPIRNLFLCSAGTHPGTGLDGRPGALASQVVINAARAGTWRRRRPW
jgi:phytoene dehydrogenase-like protein